MKYFIIGLHASGKQSIIDILSENGIKCGKHFSNYVYNEHDNLYNGDKYEFYESSEIFKIFENSAYVYIHEIPSKSIININTHKYFEGITKYEFDENEVFALSPDQLLSIPLTSIKEPVCFIWVDNTRSNRKNRFMAENRHYIFNEREEIEMRDMGAVVKHMYNFKDSHILYFTNEEPERIATIIYSIVKHEDLLPMYIEHYK